MQRGKFVQKKIQRGKSKNSEALALLCTFTPRKMTTAAHAVAVLSRAADLPLPYNGKR